MGSKRKNELFAGSEYINYEGRTIKYPSLIEHFARLNINKTSDKLMDIIGIDIETDHKTGEMKLLGFFEMDDESVKNRLYEGKYRAFTEDFLAHLVSVMKYAIREDRRLGYWNKLDSFQIFRLTLLEMMEQYPDSPDYINESLDAFNHVGGEWNKAEGCWDIPPVIEIPFGNIHIGIVSAIRSSMQLFIIDDVGKLNTVWVYDINSMYNTSLLRASRRFSWYSKVDDSAHLVDWVRFDNDKNYRENIVLASNELDARVASALAYEAQYDFAVSNKKYPKSLISMGGLARTSIVSQITMINEKKGLNGTELQEHIYDDVASIGILYHIDEWSKTSPENAINVFNLACESYSGGMIEAIRYGYSKKGYYADLASAYPAQIADFYDLRGSTLQYGTGTPPTPKEAYIFIRGVCNIPEHINYNPLTIKHPSHKDTNIRASGKYRASYTWDERKYLIDLGATFSNEEWVLIQTTGERSPLGYVIDNQYSERARLINEGNIAEEKVKTIINSMYGIQYEATDIYMDTVEGIKRIGYRAGEFFNPIYASIITSRTRIHLSMACQKIEENGGKPIILMTDSITWEGTADMLPEKLILPWGDGGVKYPKTLGYFEPPEEVHNIVCLGSGRYGYELEDKDVNKRRGLNITSLDDDSMIKGSFTWHKALKALAVPQVDELPVTVRSLISVGMIKDSKSLGVTDLGKVVDNERVIKLNVSGRKSSKDKFIDLIVGRTKRRMHHDIDDITKLLDGLVESYPLYIDDNVYAMGTFDATLKPLRDLQEGKTWTPPKERKKRNKKARNKRYYEDHKEKVLNDAKDKYNIIREVYDREKSKKLSHWSWKRIISELKRDEIYICKMKG